MLVIKGLGLARAANFLKAAWVPVQILSVYLGTRLTITNHNLLLDVYTKAT